MSKQLIPAFSKNPRAAELQGVAANQTLDVAEFFYDTIQGEGIYTGTPAAFLRLKGCVLNCEWCDTTEVWRSGDTYSFTQILDMIEEADLHYRFVEKDHHLVITGGSPLMQQYNLVGFLNEWRERFGYFPFVEVENEAVMLACPEILDLVDCWNNSPKLFTSGNNRQLSRQAIKQIGEQSDSWFKFVIVDPVDDWIEIEWLIGHRFIDKDQVILMPQGQTREELKINAPAVVELAIEKGVRFCNREHIVLWDKKTGV